MEQWLGWAIFSLVALGIIGFSVGFVWQHKMRNEPGVITTVIGTLALIFSLLSLFLIPVDVYMTSSEADLRHDMRYVYYAFDIIFMIFVFVGLPFAYFYYEELGDLEDQTNTLSKRICNALKYTICFAVALTILIVIGLFIDFSNSNSNDADWKKNVTDKFSNNSARIVPFCMAVLMAVGLFFSMVYTAWGMAGFPIDIMKSMPVQVRRDKASIDLEQSRVKDELDMLHTKYRGRDEWGKRDEIKRKSLLRKQKSLQREVRKPSMSSQDRCCARLWNATAPVRYLIGICLLLWSAVLIVSIIIHLLDQAVNSGCGYSCGFALKSRSWINPIGYVLTQSATVFPLDYIVFSAIIFWLFWCTVVGITMIDVRFLCFKLFTLRPHATMHNALMMAIGFLVLIVSSFSYMVMNLATYYVTYGGSQGNNCDYDKCDQTEIYYILSGIMIGMPVFGLIYFIFSWIFVVVFFVSLVANLLRKPGSATHVKVPDGLEPIFRD